MIKDEIFNNLSWKTTSPQEINKRIQGLKVLGIEPVEPKESGCIIYLKGNDNETIVIDIGNEYGEEPVKISYAIAK